MLELDVVDAVAAREHLRKVEDVERPGRIVGLRGVFENAVEAQAHDRDACQFRLIAILATAEAPEFEGWNLKEQDRRPVLLDVSGKPVNALPRTISFRVTVSTRDKFATSEPMPFECTKSLNDFLLDMHFQMQIFRGIEMRQVKTLKAEMIGIPADEPSEERIYRATFKLGDVRPDDRIVLVVTDGSGARLSKFHLEFL